MLQRLLWIAFAGSLGAIARYLLGGVAERNYTGGFPLGTLVVNVVGCFLCGLIWQLAEQRVAISRELRVILLVGFVGSFTTFSAYAFETSLMLRNSQWLLAAINHVAQTVVGIAAVFLGYALGKIC